MPRIPEHNRQNLARHLRLGRQTRGHSIERIAKCLGHPTSIIEDYENARLLPTHVEFQHLCRWYGLDQRAVLWPPRLRVVSTSIIGASKPV